MFECEYKIALINFFHFCRYVRDMDKVLKLFDAFTGLHWSDLSHALNRLYKLLDQNKDIPKIPRKYKISKRLSQSLHPATTTTCHISSIRDELQ